VAVHKDNPGKVASKGGKRKVATVMGEFKAGNLKSSGGAKVTSRKQALAIAMSEGRKADKPKGALHGAVVTRRRAPIQLPTLPVLPSPRTRPTLPSQASPTAVAAVAKTRPALILSRKRSRKSFQTPRDVPKAQEGAVVAPLSENLPRDLPSEVLPPAQTTNTARDLIREGIGELIKEGLWPDYS